MFKKIKEIVRNLIDKRRTDDGWRGLQVLNEWPNLDMQPHGTVRPMICYADGLVRYKAPVFEGDIADCWAYLKNWKPPFPEQYRSQWKVMWKEPMACVVPRPKPGDLRRKF